MVKPILAGLSYHYRNEMSKRQKEYSAELSVIFS